MAKILIVYGTAHGQTERIAQEIAGVLRDHDYRVSLVKGDRLPTSVAMDEYDGFVVAASVLYGRHQSYIRSFVRDHVNRLNAVPSAFVSVCGALAGSDRGAAHMAQGYLDKFLDKTGWRPTITKSFAGGLPYS